MPSCASCHSKIDPLGLAFENYDAIGRWRTRRSRRRDRRESAGESSGKLPDGRTYQTPEEFKQLLLADIDTFNARLRREARHLRPAAERCRSTTATTWQRSPQASRAKDYRLRDIVEAFVLSDLFQKR